MSQKPTFWRRQQKTPACKWYWKVVCPWCKAYKSQTTWCACLSITYCYLTSLQHFASENYLLPFPPDPWKLFIIPIVVWTFTVVVQNCDELVSCKFSLLPPSPPTSSYVMLGWRLRHRVLSAVSALSSVPHTSSLMLIAPLWYREVSLLLCKVEQELERDKWPSYQNFLASHSPPWEYGYKWLSNDADRC